MPESIQTHDSLRQHLGRWLQRPIPSLSSRRDEGLSACITVRVSVHDKNTPASSNTAQDGQAVVVCCTLELAFHRGKLQTDAGSDETFAQASSSDPQVCRNSLLEHDLAGSRDICTGFHLLTSTLSGIFLLRHELVCNVALSIPPFTTQSEPVAGQTHECERRRGYRVIPHVKRGEVAVLLTSGDTLVRHRLVCVKCGVRLCQRIAVPRPSHRLRHCIAAQRPGQKAKKEGNQRIEYVYSK